MSVSKREQKKKKKDRFMQNNQLKVYHAKAVCPENRCHKQENTFPRRYLSEDT